MNITYLVNRAVANGNLSREQEKAIFAKQGGHGGGTAYGGSASKAKDARWEADKARARAMGMSLGLSMIGGIGIAGEAKAAKTLGGIIQDARSLLTRKPTTGTVHPELAALNELSAGAKSLKEQAIKEHGYVDEATSSALRSLRAEEESIRMGVGDDVADDLWAHSGPPGGGPDPFAEAVKGARDRVAARLRAERATVAESSGRYAPAAQARRDELAAQIRLDRERKRWDMNPRAFFGNRSLADLIANAGPLTDQQRKAIFAKGGGGRPGGGGSVARDQKTGGSGVRFIGWAGQDKTTGEHAQITPQQGLSRTPTVPGIVYPAVQPPAGTHWEYDQNGGRYPIPDGAVSPAVPVKNPGQAYIGGNPDFDERTGQYRAGQPGFIGPKPAIPPVLKPKNGPPPATVPRALTDKPQSGATPIATPRFTGQAVDGLASREPPPNILGVSPTSQLFPNLTKYKAPTNTVRKLPASDQAKLDGVIAALKSARMKR